MGERNFGSSTTRGRRFHGGGETASLRFRGIMPATRDSFEHPKRGHVDEWDTYLAEMMRTADGKSISDRAKAYTLEGAAALLQKRARQEQIALPRDVALYLAQSFQSNASARRTVLRGLIAYSVLTGTEITNPYTEQLLKTFGPPGRPVAIDSLPKVYSVDAGRNETKTRRQAWTTADHDFTLCLLKISNGRKIKDQLEVNLRESERQGLARRDIYERASELQAKKRKYNA